ncbi:phage terminase small subunit P27 family [Thioclava sp. GXIMD4215]|uniref:phage terminase small subunit P27 family n=1 Tax=Thioclava sp. GXIMD4215 TaxID=3131928 RepID=UPI0032442646
MKGAKPEISIDLEAITDLDPPEWFSEEEAKEWRRVMPILSERRILTVADLGQLENYCIAIGEVRDMSALIRSKGAIFYTDAMPKRHPAAAIRADAMNRSRQLAAELGLTPVSRSRPTVRDAGDGGEDDPLDM